MASVTLSPLYGTACLVPGADRLASATFGQLLELAGPLPDAIVLRAEGATSIAASVTPKRFPRDASVSVSVKGFLFFIKTYRLRL